MIVFDCCHSGTIGDLKYVLDDNNKNIVDNQNSEISSDIIIISGCSDDKVSFETYNLLGQNKFGGACTGSIIKFAETGKTVFKLKEEINNFLQENNFSQKINISSSREITNTTNFL